jgi:hypothetical protein
MKEEPKSIWKKTIGEHRGYLILLVWFTVIAFCIIFAVGMTSSASHPFGRVFVFGWLYAFGWALVLVAIIVFFRWVACWRNFKRFLFGVACFITLIALLYAEEDLRGKYDWSQYKSQGEVKGEKFDWADFIPASVPDDQNFAFSPVWIASVEYSLGSNTNKAEAWYGDRIDDDDVAKFLPLMPVTPSAVVGTNWAGRMTSTPDQTPGWPVAHMLNLNSWHSFYRDLEEKSPDAEIRITPQPQSPAADVLLALGKYDPVIKQLQQDSQLPYSRFPVQYNEEPTASILLPHLAPLKQCAQVLELRAIAELQNNQPDLAFHDVMLMLHLTGSLRTEPFIITHLVRMAIMQMALQVIYEGLANHQWSDTQLAGMDSELARIDYLADFQNCIRSERAAHAELIAWLEQKRSRSKELLDWFDNSKPQRGLPKGLVEADFYVMPAGQFYQGDIDLSNAHQLWAGAVDDTGHIVSPSAVLQASNSVVSLLSHPTSYIGVIGRLLTPELSAYAKRTAFAQESADLARVAIALERYRLAHGDFPDSLDALSPQFMQQVPHDIINGDPLHYRLTQDGQFVLYSVGWNGTDDGGVAVPAGGGTKGSIGTGVNVNEGDWAWRYPAK